MSSLQLGVLFATEEQLCQLFKVDIERVREVKPTPVGTYYPPGRGGQSLYSVRRVKEALGV